MARKLVTTLVAGTALVGAGAAASAPGHATLVIRHQTRGCHTWSVNGGAFRASQKITLARGASLTITNNDVMPHKLVLTKGPAVKLSGPANLAHMGATVTVTFGKAGVYRFTTKPGEDYVAGIKTVGPDNVLRLTVRVA